MTSSSVSGLAVSVVCYQKVVDNTPSLCIDACRAVWVPVQDLGYAAFDAQLRKAYLATTLHAMVIRTSGGRPAGAYELASL